MSDSDRFDGIIDRIVSDRSPRADVKNLSDEEKRMVRMAQLIRGTGAHTVDPAFRDRLYGRMFGGGRKYSRRAAFLSSLSALAAGLVAGLGIDRAFGTSREETQRTTPLVGAQGRWVPVAQVVDVPHGAVHPFVAGPIQGYVLNQHGRLRAVSRVCTHMGCAVNFKGDEQHFVCPCHGAEFDLHGRFLYGLNGSPYSPALDPLPPINVRVHGSAVEVWTV